MALRPKEASLCTRLQEHSCVLLPAVTADAAAAAVAVLHCAGACRSVIRVADPAPRRAVVASCCSRCLEHTIADCAVLVDLCIVPTDCTDVSPAGLHVHM